MPSRNVQLRNFGSDQSGAVAIIFGLCFVVLSLVLGLAVDSARISNATTRVQAALDAAALAAAKKMNVEDSTPHEIREAARTFFEGQIPTMNVNDAELSNFNATFDREEGTVITKVDVSLPTIMGAIAQGDPRLRFTPKSSSTFKSKKIEIALVLDVTGSMCSPCTKLEDLKAAAKQMVDTLYAKNPDPGAIKVSLIPYSASVNVGGSLFSEVAVTEDAVDHCVMEREGINMHTNAVPANGSLFETTGNTPIRPGYSCPDSEIVPLTDLSDASDRNTFKSAIDNLTTGGWTAGHLGLAWGWYSISPEWSSIWSGDSIPRPYKEEVIKAVILMTDGEFNTSYWDNGINLVDAQRTDPLIVDSSGYQALQLCGKIKDRAVEEHGPDVFTISFQAPPEADALMQECAGASNAFTADNRDTLIQSFTDIAERLTNLSLTQ